jgi:hypothetical protein
MPGGTDPAGRRKNLENRRAVWQRQALFGWVGVLRGRNFAPASYEPMVEVARESENRCENDWNFGNVDYLMLHHNVE